MEPPSNTTPVPPSPSGWWRDLGPTAVLGVVWTAAPALLGATLLVFLGPVSDFLHGMGSWGWLVYASVFVVSAGVGFLPTYGQSFLGGWVFGFAAGFPGAMTGFVGGAIIGFFISKFVAHHRVEELLNKSPKTRAARDALIGHGFWRTLFTVSLIRCPPNSPFALTNLALASAGVKFAPYVLGTAIGMAPRTGIACFLAAGAASSGAKDIQQFVKDQPWWVVPAGFALTAVVLGVIGFIANRAIKHVTAPKA